MPIFFKLHICLKCLIITINRNDFHNNRNSKISINNNFIIINTLINVMNTSIINNRITISNSKHISKITKTKTRSKIDHEQTKNHRVLSKIIKGNDLCRTTVLNRQKFGIPEFLENDFHPFL